MFKKIYGVLVLLLCTACASSGQSLWHGSGSFGVTIDSRLMKGSLTKNGVEGTSDTGKHLFGFAELNDRGGQTSGFGGIGLPKWVDVSWREGKFIQRYDPVNQSVWTGGEITGRHRIEVASRIPKEVLRYAGGKKGRSVVLMLRILDDDVVLGWCVRDISEVNDWFEPNYSGDFMPAKWVDGKLISMGWYLDRKTGRKVETLTGRVS